MISYNEHLAEILQFAIKSDTNFNTRDRGKGGREKALYTRRNILESAEFAGKRFATKRYYSVCFLSVFTPWFQIAISFFRSLKIQHTHTHAHNHNIDYHTYIYTSNIVLNEYRKFEKQFAIIHYIHKSRIL